MGQALKKPTTICFALGAFGVALLAVFWMYPTLLHLFFGGGSQASTSTDGFTWFAPVLLLALLMSAWLSIALMAIIHPGLISNVLPDFLRKGLPISDETGPASQSFRYGRTFVMNSLAGKVLIWPAVFWGAALLTPILFAHVGGNSPWNNWMVSPFFWLPALILSGTFFLALFVRLFVPTLFAAIGLGPTSSSGGITAKPPMTAWPFLLGVIVASVLVPTLSFTGILPSSNSSPGRSTIEEEPEKFSVRSDKSFEDINQMPAEEVGDRKTEITEWDSHYLNVMGENYWPIARAFSTPFVTAYHIQERGYIPSTPMGPVNTKSPCQQKWYAPDRAAGLGAASESVADEAVVATPAAGQSVGREFYAYVSGCPRGLGSGWDVGSSVFDDQGTDLAGFYFKTNPYAYEVVSTDGQRFVVFPENEPESRKDPAIVQLVLGGLLVERSPNMTEKERRKTVEELQRFVHRRGMNSQINSLPLRTDYDSDEIFDEAYVEAIQNEIEVLIKHRSKDLGNRSSGAPENILINIRYSSKDLAAQQKRIEKRINKAIAKIRLRNNSNVTALSFGNELPICADDSSDACWSLNRSVSIYMQ